jgi:hypothetical protein
MASECLTWTGVPIGLYLVLTYGYKLLYIIII